MNTFRFKLPRAKLDAAPEDERIFFLLLGHSANQVAMLNKWAAWCNPNDNVGELEGKGRVAQSMMVLGLFAAKLIEGWVLVERQYFGSRISKNYADLLDAEARDALKDLGKYFSTSNAIRTCRNEYAFHYDPNVMKEHYAAIPKDEETEIFVSEYGGCNLFQVSEVAASYSLLTSIGKGDIEAGLHQLISDTTTVARLFHEFAGGYMLAFVTNRLGATKGESQEIVGLPHFDEVRIPFLAEMGPLAPSLRRASQWKN